MSDEPLVAVLYHRNCPDGFGGAYAAWLRLSQYTEATYLPMLYTDPPPELPAGSRVYIIDFSFNRETMEALHRRHGPENVRLLDHHETARDELDGLPNCLITMEKSGAMLAWEEFHDGPAPALFEYIQDRDLWQWRLSGSREVSALVSSLRYDFMDWWELDRRLLVDRAGVIAAGSAILDFQSRQIERLLEVAQLTEVCGYLVPTANSALLVSEVGDAMLEAYPDRPFAAIYHDNLGFRKWSLRSRGDFNVATLARTMGGGGHRRAAAFTTHDTRENCDED